MKLQVKCLPAVGVPGGMAYMLCDEAGEPLPGQVRVKVENAAGELARVTVTFKVTGDTVRLAP